MLEMLAGKLLMSLGRLGVPNIGFIVPPAPPFRGLTTVLGVSGAKTSLLCLGKFSKTCSVCSNPLRCWVTSSNKSSRPILSNFAPVSWAIRRWATCRASDRLWLSLTALAARWEFLCCTWQTTSQPITQLINRATVHIFHCATLSSRDLSSSSVKLVSIFVM